MLKWNRKRPGKVIWALQFSLDGTESRKIALRKSSKKFSVWLRLQSSAVVRCACPLKSVYFWTQKVRQYPKWILRITLKASWSYRRIIPKFDKMVILKIFKNAKFSKISIFYDFNLTQYCDFRIWFSNRMTPNDPGGHHLVAVSGQKLFIFYQFISDISIVRFLL